jgi:asparagine synthase (glutamine-hydrolysing)
MCAIAGIVSLTSMLPIESEQCLQMMLAKLQQRGPDGLAVHVDAAAQFGFGHARLAIIAPMAAAIQPFFSQDRNVSVTFNGEIYNYLELRKELRSLGRMFVTETDTEVLVVAYQEWGINFLARLEGMFAFALFDKATREFLLVRDRIGAKPVYFSLQGGYLTFASEVRAIITLPWIKPVLSEYAVYEYLTFMAIPAPATSFKGIYKMPAGYFLKVDAAKTINFEQWYCPIKATFTQSKLMQLMEQAEVVEQLTSLLKQSVKMRLISDVPVSIFLSGGLDSSLLVALAAQNGKPPATFNVSFKNDTNTDEKKWASLVAQMFGAKHHTLEIEPSQVEGLVENMFAACDQPLADCVNVPLLAISQSCSASGFKVVLVGEGADEIFFGYPEYAKQQKLAQIFSSRPLKMLQQVGAKVCYRLASWLWANNSALSLLHHWAQNTELFWGGAIAFQEHEKELLRRVFSAQYNPYDPVVAQIFPQLKQEFGSQNLINFFASQIYEYFPNADFAQKIAFLELKHRIPDLLLARLDMMTMACGLEGREPFLDHRLVEFALALPFSQRSSGGGLKPLLKQVARKFLPPDLVHRKKVGFGAPVKTWFEQQLIKPGAASSFWPYEKFLPKAGSNYVKRWALGCLSDFSARHA